MKNCSKCKQLLNDSEFSKSNKETSGLRNRCIKCEKEDYRLKHPFKDNSFTNLPGEVWKDVVGYEEFYKVSSHGRMYTKDRYKPAIAVNGTPYIQFIQGKLKRITLSKHPKQLYFQVLLSVNKNIKTIKVHRIVAKAFIPNPDNKPYINHIDANKLNNKVENLEWCTAKENSHHAISLGLIGPPKNGEECNFSVLKEKDVLEIRAIGKSKTLKQIGKMYNIHFGAIHSILKRKTWKHI